MMRCRAGVACAILVGLAAGACDNGSSPEADGQYRSPVGPVPAQPQRPGDPAAGYEALLNEPYVGCGPPLEAYRLAAPETPARDRLPDRRDRNAELPYHLTAFTNADGVEVVASNCLICHAARFNGELVVGLGNEFWDFTGDPRRLTTEIGAYVRGEAETAAWQRWADRIDGIAPYVQMRTVGVNPATNLTWALMAHRNPETLAWSQTPLLEPPPREPLPVSVPPWWRMKKKHALFYTTLGRGDHARFMILASMLCADSVPKAKSVDRYAPDIRAYIADLGPPSYPFEIDASLVEQGEVVFQEYCARCHGSYGEDASYPNLVIALDVIGTDPEYALAATDGRRDRFYRWLAASYYGETAHAAPARGYIAPPLDGVWATAPYLHNGAVPDVQSLLDSSTRPRYWRHLHNPRSYDSATLGWRYAVLTADELKDAPPSESVRIYDTTVTGYGNGGHTFGDRLSEQQRAAVIEYLKTL